ncbi:CAAX prenyl protease 1, partial [Phytophthora palmivora]
MEFLSSPYFTEAGWRPSASPVPYFQGALVFMTIVYLFETYLDVRQHRKLHDKQFPKPLTEAIEGLGNYSIKKKESEEESDDTKQESESEMSLLAATQNKFDKSRAYGLDKSTFGFVSGAYNQLEATAFLLLGYLPFMWTMSGKALLSIGLDADNEIYRALMLLTLTTIRDTLVGIPFGLYSTFVVEARHGFNKQTLGLFFMDKIKSFGLFIVIGFPVTAALIYVIRWGGEYFYMYVWAFLFVFSVVMMTLYPVLIMPLFNKFTPLEEGVLR